MSLPRNLIQTDWFREVATWNPVSYLIEAVRSLLITGWDGEALAVGFAVAIGLIAVGTVAASLALLARRTLRSLLTWKDSGAARIWALPLMITGWVIVSVLWRPGLIPDQPWASRRLVPVVLPGLILAAVWAAAFAVNTLCDVVVMAAPGTSTLLNWVVPALVIVAAIRFTAWYPAHATAEARAGAHEASAGGAAGPVAP